jgi:ACS family sodium-dependent inorganic phosphate cotransporter
MAFLGYVNLYTMRVDLSVAIVALTENRSVTYENGSVGFEQYFNWDSKERGIALSAFFYGYITTQVVLDYQCVL